MKHARQDYQHIQDETGRIPEDEPVFLLRAQDATAAATVRHWAEMNRRNGGDPDLIKSAEQQADEMERWPTHKKADAGLPKATPYRAPVSKTKEETQEKTDGRREKPAPVRRASEGTGEAAD